MRLTAAEEHAPCIICAGTGEYRGVFHLNGCVACNGAGVVLASGEAMSLEDAVQYLRTELTQAQRRAPRPARSTVLGDAEQYQQTNTRGPGGSHFSGD